MGAGRAFEIGVVTDRRTDEGPFHDERVEDEVAQQNAHREDEDRRIGRQHAGGGGFEVVEVHRRGHEAVEERHQDAGQHRQQNAFAVLRRGTRLLPDPSRSDSVADDGDDDQHHAEEQNDGVALRRSQVIDDHAQHQRQTHAQRKGDGQSGQRHGGGKQDVRGVEDDAAEQYAAEGLGRSLREIFEEGTPFAADAAQRKAEDQRKKEHADDIVPVEKFITPCPACQFLGVAPRAPAQHRDNAEYHGCRIIVYYKHIRSFKGLSFGRRISRYSQNGRRPPHSASGSSFAPRCGSPRGRRRALQSAQRPRAASLPPAPRSAPR